MKIVEGSSGVLLYVTILYLPLFSSFCPFQGEKKGNIYYMVVSLVSLTYRCHLIHWNLSKKCAKYTHMLSSTQVNIVLLIDAAHWTMLYTVELVSLWKGCRLFPSMYSDNFSLWIDMSSMWCLSLSQLQFPSQGLLEDCAIVHIIIFLCKLHIEFWFNNNSGAPALLAH